MNLLKHYPHISVLLLVSIFLSLIGVYAAVLTLALESSSERKDIRLVPKTANDGNKSVVALPKSSVGNSSDRPSVSVIKQVGTAKAVFNPNTYTTICQTEIVLLHKTGKSEFSMSANFEEEGYRIGKPNKISLRMDVRSEDVSYVYNRAFKIFLDGNLAFRKENDLLGTENDNGIVTAFLRQNEFPYELFVSMSQAKNVQFQVGATSFELKESNIQSFRDLVVLVDTKMIKNPVTTERDAPPIRKSVTTVVRPSH